MFLWSLNVFPATQRLMKKGLWEDTVALLNKEMFPSSGAPEPLTSTKKKKGSSSKTKKKKKNG
jgi:hypothetical protein